MSIQRITSKKVELPIIYLIENEEDYKTLPRGLPYILANAKELDFIRIFIEYQVLLRSALKTGLAIKWSDCFKRLGYSTNLKKYELQSGGTFVGNGSGSGEIVSLDDFIEDQYLVNFDKLAELKILPKWLDDLKTAVETNIIDEVIFDPTAFNKQLGMNVGSGTRKSNIKNLLILDVSGSMPRAVVKTITNLAKLMSKKFYADVMITSGKTVLIDYEQVQSSDIIEIARLSGYDNEGVMYRKIVKEFKEYNTIISMGDDDNPGNFDRTSKSTECNFTCETLYSLHTNQVERVTGYAKWFKPKKETIFIKDWICTIQN
jgi:hypothetical protein